MTSRKLPETQDNSTVVKSSDKTRVYLRPSASSQESLERELGTGDIIKQRFVLDKILGTGGMGAVFRALDLRKQEAGDTRPHVALKILGEDFKRHPEALVTLQREARKTQDLAHPNIVTVYDFDRDGDLVYLTMEELKGRSLHELLSDPRAHLDFSEKISILQQIAQGLAYAHSKGLVHSDLKPANIFIGDDNHVKILDFGIARAVSAEIYEDSFDAGTLGAITSTYASPEMLSSQPPHPSDDIYALGVIACELFNNRHPYDRKDAREALSKHLKPLVPHFKNPLLNNVILRSLALQREKRIADGEAFLKQLRGALAIPKRLAVGLLVAALALLGNFIYLQQVTPVSIKLTDLPMEAQTSFKSHIHETEVALGFGDLQGAVHHIDQAYKIHKTDKTLLKLRDNILQLSRDNLARAASEEEKHFYQEQLNQLKAYPAFSQPQ